MGPAVIRKGRVMTIRAAILRGSMALVIVAIVLSGSLSLIEVRQTFQSEIARNLGNSASGLLERIDAFFFERLEDLREWRRVELMQDIQVGDVDKRLARLLSDLKTGHGDVYSTLYCTNMQGRIVASSDPGLIGRVRLPEPAMRSAYQDHGVVVLEKTTAAAPEGAGQYVLRTVVPAVFGSGALGYLYPVLNWNAVRRFLADAIKGPQRTALLLDTDHRIIAAAGSHSHTLSVSVLGLVPSVTVMVT